MNILVTGGAGFIGSHLCDALLEEGHRVVVIDNLRLGRIENISHLICNANFSFIKADLLDTHKLNDIFTKESFEEVYHLAANSDIEQSGQTPSIDKELTFQTTFNILTCMKNQGVNRLIFTSSSAIYGHAKEYLREDSGPLFPVSMYGAAKLASEAFISAFSENYGLQAWIFRFPNIVGERATHGVIFDFINKLKADPTRLKVLGDGFQSKPYLYVKELIRGILFVRKHAKEKLNCFNIGVDSQTTVRTIVKMVTEEMGLKPEITYGTDPRGWIGDVPTYRYDLEKIHNIGWYSSFTSDESVKYAINAIKNILALSR